MFRTNKMSNNNFQIGSAPVDPLEEAQLFFHQFKIYDNSWPSGTVKFDALTKEFYVLADTPEVLLETPQPVNSSKPEPKYGNLGKKNITLPKNHK